MLFVAVDDHARIAFTATPPDERAPSAVSFRRTAAIYDASLGISVRDLLTDNGAAFRSTLFKAACVELGIKHRLTRVYRPQTNGKAERFIQSALREWAYGHACRGSSERTHALDHRSHHCNWHRPHHGIGLQPPMSELPGNNNLLTTPALAQRPNKTLTSPRLNTGNASSRIRRKASHARNGNTPR